MKRLILFLTSFLVVGTASACPFCSENLSKNSAGFGGGLGVGISITIFLFLGMMGSLVGFVAYLMIQEGKKSDKRHEAKTAVLP